jgi:hypothetical protein
LPPEFGVRQQKAPESDEELDGLYLLFWIIYKKFSDYEMELDESPPSVPKVASRVEVMRKEADTQDSSQLRGLSIIKLVFLDLI